MTRLYVMSELEEDAVFEIEKDVTLLGRSPDNDIVLRDSSVSRRHAQILRRGDRFLIQDLGSRNGTWINGLPCTSGSEYELKQNLAVAVGNATLSLGEKPPYDQEQRPLRHEEVEIDADLKDLEKASRFARDFVQKRIHPPLSEERSWQFEIAVDEAVANIIKHAYAGTAGGRIRIVADAFPDRVEVRLHHWGRAFDRNVAPPPKLDGTEESGYGLFLMDQSMDRVDYSTGEQGKSTISLVKFRRDS